VIVDVGSIIRSDGKRLPRALIGFLRLLRSIALLLALFLIVTPVLSVGLVMAMRAASIIPEGAHWTGLSSVPEFLCTCAFFVVVGWLYGLVFGRVDKRSMRELAELLVIVCLVTSVGGVMERWNSAPPAFWNWVLLSAILFPCVTLGGWIAMRRQ